MLSKALLHAMSDTDTAEDRQWQSDHADFETRSLTLAPGAVQSVGLGIYASTVEMPIFDLSFTPATMEDMIGVSLERLDIPGKSKYMPFYQLHNFGDKPCTIRVSCHDASVVC